jgi:hypothetical protein
MGGRVPVVANPAVHAQPLVEMRRGVIPSSLCDLDQPELERAELGRPEVASAFREGEQGEGVTFGSREVSDLELHLFEGIERFRLELGRSIVLSDRQGTLGMFESPVETQAIRPGDR